MRLADFDLSRIRTEDIGYHQVVGRVTPDELPVLVDELYDAMDEIVNQADDSAVVFVPKDPAAKDEERGWPLSHVVAHVTAGVDESAALASVLARGARVEGRPRSETPWETLTTTAQLRQRIAESRRMDKAFLQTWPDQPFLL